MDRAGAFLEELKQSENGDTGLVVSNGGTIHAMLYYLLEKSPETFWQPWIDNCTLIRMKVEGGQWEIEEQYRQVIAADGTERLI